MTFISYDKKGNRHEYSDLSENEVIVKLEEPYYVFHHTYQPGEEIVVPLEVAQRIRCKIIGKWKDKI